MTSADSSAGLTADASAEPYVCEHCDDSVPHEHVDEAPLVEGYRNRLRSAVLAVCAVLVVGLTTSALTGGLPTMYAAVLGALAWGVAHGIGLVALALVRARRTTRGMVVAGAIATAAASPLVALVVSAIVDGGAVHLGVNAALGWLAVGNLVAGVRGGRLRALLVADSRDGEAARSGVVRSKGEPSPYAEGAWLLATAAVFGLCVAATAVLPVLVLVLVPLNVALAVLSRRSHLRAGRR